jgi:hypothetical protein
VPTTFAGAGCEIGRLHAFERCSGACQSIHSLRDKEVGGLWDCSDTISPRYLKTNALSGH